MDFQLFPQVKRIPSRPAVSRVITNHCEDGHMTRTWAGGSDADLVSIFYKSYLRYQTQSNCICTVYNTGEVLA